MKSCSLGAQSAQWNDTWEPTCSETGATRKIALYIDGPVYGDKIYRATDTYPAGTYDSKTRTTVLVARARGVSSTDRCPPGEDA